MELIFRIGKNDWQLIYSNLCPIIFTLKLMRFPILHILKTEQLTRFWFMFKNLSNIHKWFLRLQYLFLEKKLIFI